MRKAATTTWARELPFTMNQASSVSRAILVGQQLWEEVIRPVRLPFTHTLLPLSGGA